MLVRRGGAMGHVYQRQLQLRPAFMARAAKWLTPRLPPLGRPGAWMHIATVSGLVLAMCACTSAPPVVAVIPRACGTVLWEPEHAGAAEAARGYGLSIFWNAPTRANDIQKQIALVEKLASGHYVGIVLSPDETLALRTPIKRLLTRHIPLVVVGTDLGIDPDRSLSYVLSDEKAAGEMAARRVGSLLHSQGSVAILGMDPKLSNITQRERSFESALAAEFPNIHVLTRRLGQTNVSQEQQTAEELLQTGSMPDALVALSAESTRGAYYALVEFRKTKAIKLIGFDQDLLPPLRTGELDSVIAENTYEMGRQAIAQIEGQLHGTAVPQTITVLPRLVTSENIDTPEIRKIFSAHWWNQE
jgi:ribose transport system substrate-binding protein